MTISRRDALSKQTDQLIPNNQRAMEFDALKAQIGSEIATAKHAHGTRQNVHDIFVNDEAFVGRVMGF